ncbi:hypothetical protein [Bacillus sp. AFS055030]|uniref:hypothetical protein n=1 Tax=Bacillus sp. AFS055030 TaxID=2033507 RepID=UPI000BFE2F4E|nr:hypothetical protein [Bacillus sp. AFS055030]PGL73246.1 hypothetical protein CN925_00915 [Bacillus sp. AFS055030]
MLLVKEKVYSTNKSLKSDETIHTEVFQMNEEKEIKLKFLSLNSPRNQGVGFISENGISRNNAPKQKTIIIWGNEIQSELILKCSRGFLNVFNVWEEERMVGFHDFHSGMRMKKEKDFMVYSCNDAFANGDFTSLVFSIQIL